MPFCALVLPLRLKESSPACLDTPIIARWYPSQKSLEWSLKTAEGDDSKEALSSLGPRGRLREALKGVEWKVLNGRHILVKPTGEGDDGKLPLVVNIHGGPHTVYDTSFFFTSVFWAKLGGMD